MQSVILVSTSCPEEADADRIARALVENRLAACVQRIGPVRSTYRWNGAIETADEYVLAVKTTADRYPELERAIRQMHPYELPEIVAVAVGKGLPAYLRWIGEETQAPASGIA